jgi:hypothetical protein
MAAADSDWVQPMERKPLGDVKRADIATGFLADWLDMNGLQKFQMYVQKTNCNGFVTSGQR